MTSVTTYCARRYYTAIGDDDDDDDVDETQTRTPFFFSSISSAVHQWRPFMALFYVNLFSIVCPLGLYIGHTSAPQVMTNETFNHSTMLQCYNVTMLQRYNVPSPCALCRRFYIDISLIVSLFYSDSGLLGPITFLLYKTCVCCISSFNCHSTTSSLGQFHAILFKISKFKTCKVKFWFSDFQVKNFQFLGNKILVMRSKFVKKKFPRSFFQVSKDFQV